MEAGAAEAARLEEVVAALREQQFPVNVERDPVTMLPILKINGCPYPELSGENHDICEVEAAMFSELLGSPVKLRHCRCDSPDGGCVFDVSRESLEAGETTSNAAPGTLDTSQLSTSQLGTAHMDHTHSGSNHQQASGNLENCTSN